MARRVRADASRHSGHYAHPARSAFLALRPLGVPRGWGGDIWRVGRTQLRPSLRDFLIAPNHTQAYTLGLQWRGGNWRDGSFRVQSEITQLEQSATFRDGPIGSWYTSTRVIQGYTNRGQTLGASIGPGASSQWLAVDYLKPGWRLGAFMGRIRWNQDVHNNAGLPVYVGYCSMDVSIYPGVRGAKAGTLRLFHR